MTTVAATTAAELYTLVRPESLDLLNRPAATLIAQEAAKLYYAQFGPEVTTEEAVYIHTSVDRFLSALPASPPTQFFKAILHYLLSSFRSY